MSKDELLQSMEKVDREITQVEQQINNLKKKQVRLAADHWWHIFSLMIIIVKTVVVSFTQWAVIGKTNQLHYCMLWKWWSLRVVTLWDKSMNVKMTSLFSKKHDLDPPPPYCSNICNPINFCIRNNLKKRHLNSPVNHQRKNHPSLNPNQKVLYRWSTRKIRSSSCHAK